jgi:hypothetical protein
MYFSTSGGREVTTKRQTLKKFFSRHHELVTGYRMSVTQIRTDLHLLLTSFPSSDGTSTDVFFYFRW